MEPIYHDAPVWLQLVNELDMFFFSWFYVLSVIVFVSKRQDRAWYRGLAPFMAGMMTYAISLYLIWEMLTYRQTGAQLASVVMFNGRCLVNFGLLIRHVHVLRSGSA